MNSLCEGRDEIKQPATRLCQRSGRRDEHENPNAWLMSQHPGSLVLLLFKLRFGLFFFMVMSMCAAGVSDLGFVRTSFVGFKSKTPLGAHGIQTRCGNDFVRHASALRAVTQLFEFSDWF